MPGPSWLTSWVKVNNRHVAYAQPSPSGVSPRAAGGSNRQSPRAGRVMSRREGTNTRDSNASKPQVSSTNGGGAPSSPKNNRSLRSGSLSAEAVGKSSDSSASQSKREEPLFGVSTALLADLSIARPETSNSNRELTTPDPTLLPAPPTRRRSGKKSASYDENRAQSRESDLASAHNLLAGFFAAPSPAVDDGDTGSAATYPRFNDRRRVGAANHHHQHQHQQQQQQQQPAFRSTGRYLNEAAFVQQLEQRKLADSRRLKENGHAPVASVPDAKSLPPPLPPSTPIPETSLSMRPSRHSRLHHSASSVKSDASPSAMSAPPAFGGGLKLFPPSFFPVDKPCESCKSLQSKLEAALDDVEYLRTAVLEQEMATVVTGPAPSTTGMRPTQQKPDAMEASRQIGEATQRHRKQVEQLTKERIRWQQDIHFKLHKFANLCKDLNEESVVRNETALTLEQELIEVKDERDAILKERNELLARVKQLERHETENQQMKQLLHQQENEGLRNAEEAIQSRDHTISELTRKLDKTLDELEMERAQRQRRQIIFPVNGATFNETPNL